MNYFALSGLAMGGGDHTQGIALGIQVRRSASPERAQ
jgi:hypothetical protein